MKSSGSKWEGHKKEVSYQENRNFRGKRIKGLIDICSGRRGNFGLIKGKNVLDHRF